MRTTAYDVASAVGGDLVGRQDVAVTGAAIDSRLLAPGQLFVPVVAERDGHDFVKAAVAAGASAYLSAKGVLTSDATAILVDDTVSALTRWATAARRALPDRVVGITGSVGKTSTKDMCAAILRRGCAVGAATGSFNNELGVPLTLLNAPADAQALVVEMGARDVGHIAWLCSIARPTVGVVTRVAPAHLGIFGSIEAVARAKAEIVRDLPASGTAVLNADDERVLAMRSATQARVVLVSAEGAAGADVVARDVVLDDALRPHFTLASPWGTTEVSLRARGTHNVGNALAASAAALSAGASLDDVCAGLAEAAISRWRMELRRTPSGALILNDAYNANPTSMRVALTSLAALPARRRLAVLGRMEELGDGADAEHAQIGALARELGIETLAVGTDAYGGASVRAVDDVAAALGALGEGDAVLVKASRAAGLERVVDGYESTPVD